MHEPQIALQVQFASFDAEDGSDPRERGRSILRQERVLAALRDASADWADEEEAVVLIPVSDDGQVVTLDSDDRLAFDLTVERLRELFTAAGLTLWLQSPRDLDDEEELSDLDEELIAELEEEFERQADDDDEDETPDDLFAAEPVRVAEFSHRGPLAARLAAQMHDTEVAYRERGDWSMMTYRTGEAGSGGALPPKPRLGPSRVRPRPRQDPVMTDDAERNRFSARAARYADQMVFEGFVPDP